MVVLQAPLRATSVNNVATFAASRALQKTFMKNAHRPAQERPIM
jgi:hypothetical protein